VLVFKAGSEDYFCSWFIYSYDCCCCSWLQGERTNLHCEKLHNLLLLLLLLLCRF